MVVVRVNEGEYKLTYKEYQVWQDIRIQYAGFAGEKVKNCF